MISFISYNKFMFIRTRFIILINYKKGSLYAEMGLLIILLLVYRKIKILVCCVLHRKNLNNTVGKDCHYCISHITVTYFNIFSRQYDTVKMESPQATAVYCGCNSNHFPLTQFIFSMFLLSQWYQQHNEIDHVIIMLLASKVASNISKLGINLEATSYCFQFPSKCKP